MASRPVFLPNPDGKFPFVEERLTEFEWFPGFSREQAQRSIQSLHSAAVMVDLSPLLEISSKSPNPLGVQLSAFNLQLMRGNQRMSVECAYQGSKVFEHGGPYQELYQFTSRDAKKYERLTNSGRVIAFKYFEEKFDIEPKTAFYDWLYLQALVQNEDLARNLTGYKGFTDIAFNPERSLSCQARSAALFVSLNQRDDFDLIIKSGEYYLTVVSEKNVSAKAISSVTQLRLSLPDEPSS